MTGKELIDSLCKKKLRDDGKLCTDSQILILLRTIGQI